MADDFNRRFKEMLEQQKQINAGAKELEKSLGKQLEMQNDIYQMKKNIANTSAVIAESEEQVNKSDEEIKNLNAEINSLKNSTLEVDRKRVKELKKQLKEEKKLRDYNRDRLGLAKEELKSQEKGLETMKQMVKESSKLKSTLRSGGKFFKAWGWDNLKKWGVFEMDKEIRNTVRSMGAGGESAKILRNNLSQAADSTTMMGANLKDLAKMQAGYSKGIGRAVKLSVEGNKAMAEMSEGTGLGAEFAIGMATSMDNFGLGAIASKDLVQETVDIAAEMGVNAQASSEALNKNLKLAQRFHFKGGVKALAKMANEATRLKLDMDGIAGIAEKVFRPEGAVEMAAKLQTMGGAFAQMADPMQLMFKARNDFKGFAKDIGKATSEFVDYNSKTGEFQIKGGLAADRMREIANMTGLSVEKLQEMAVQQKKIEQIGGMTPFNFSKEDRELVAGMAKFDESKGGMVVQLDGRDTLVKDLKKADLEKLKGEKKLLEDRAKDARTFEDVLEDLKTTLKQILLPIAEGLKEGIGKPLQNLQKEWRNNGFYDTLRDFAKSAVNMVTGLGKPLIDFVTAIGPGGTLAAIIGGGALFNAAKWILNGRMLAMGFNMGAKVGGGSGGGGGMFGGGGSGLGGMLRGGKKGGLGRNLLARGTKMGRMGGHVFGKGGGMTLGKSLMKGGKAFTGLGAVGLAADVGRMFLDDPDSQLGKGLGVAGTAASWAGTGALLGSVIPGVGTAIGGAIGGILGGAKGAYDEYIADPEYSKFGGNNALKLDDGIIQFNPNDKFTKVNDALIAGTNVNGNKDLAKAITNDGGNGKVEHKFDDISITVKVVGEGLDSDIAKKLINDKELIRALNTKIKEEAAMVLSNGKLSPTPR